MHRPTVVSAAKLNGFFMLDPSNDPEWISFVRDCVDAQIFHHPQWLKLLHAQYGFRTLAACTVQDGHIAAGAPICEIRSPLRPLRWTCLPFSDRCGPLGRSPQDVISLMRLLVSAADRAGASLEVRDVVPAGAGMRTQVDHFHHQTRLEGLEGDLFARLHPDVRRSIRKARSNGLTATIRCDEEAIDRFYALHLLTRRRQGIPIQPRRYFTLFRQHILDEGLGFVTLVEHGADTLSAGVFCLFGNTVLYKYGASDPSASRAFATYLMCWTAITHARDCGIQVFDFGKTSVSNQGLRFFKQKWASDETQLTCSYSPSLPSGRTSGFILSKVLQPLIRNSPTTVCRVAGEILYKHFAS
jgi:CelD/BcsL family acetyltransferase involved in cellulose biosynthesis